MSDKDVGERLKIARKQAGFGSAAEAAEALGMKYPTYAGHENGNRGVVRAAARYARRYGVSLDWLLQGKGDGPQPGGPPAIKGEAEIKEMLGRIEGLPQEAVHPLFRIIMGYVEDAERSSQPHSPAQTAPASLPREPEPSR